MPDEHLTFEDVPPDHPARQCISAVVAARVIAPLSMNPPRFAPDYAVTRAQFAVYLSRAMGLEPRSVAEPSFADVPRSHWALEFVEAIYARMIMAGGLANPPRFLPDESVTRAAAAIALVRAKGMEPLRPSQATFADVPLDHWASGWIERLVDRDSWGGVVVAAGCDPGPAPQFCPDEVVTRAQLAVFLCRAFSIGGGG
jgi:hypothetical protein